MAGRAGIRVDWGLMAGALLFILIGAGFAGFGGWYLVTTQQFLGAAEDVTGTVIAPNESCDDEDGCTYWPEFEFASPEGETLRARTQFGSSEYGFGEGEAVTILYNPAYDYVRIPGAGNLWLFGVGFFGLGVFALAVGLWLAIRHAVYRPRQGSDG